MGRAGTGRRSAARPWPPGRRRACAPKAPAATAISPESAASASCSRLKTGRPAARPRASAWLLRAPSTTAPLVAVVEVSSRTVSPGCSSAAAVHQRAALAMHAGEAELQRPLGFSDSRSLSSASSRSAARCSRAQPCAARLPVEPALRGVRAAPAARRAAAASLVPEPAPRPAASSRAETAAASRSRLAARARWRRSAGPGAKRAADAQQVALVHGGVLLQRRLQPAGGEVVALQRVLQAALAAAAEPPREQSSPARSSASTGVAISAAPVGVGARRSETKSIRVVSVSWPTARDQRDGPVGHRAGQRLVVERPRGPPPSRRRGRRSARRAAATGPPGAMALKPRIGGDDLGRGARRPAPPPARPPPGRASGRGCGAGCRGSPRRSGW